MYSLNNKKACMSGVEICGWAEETRERDRAQPGQTDHPFPFYLSRSSLPNPLVNIPELVMGSCPEQVLYFSLGTIALALYRTNEYYLILVNLRLSRSQLCNFFPYQLLLKVMFSISLRTVTIVPRKTENKTHAIFVGKTNCIMENLKLTHGKASGTRHTPEGRLQRKEGMQILQSGSGVTNDSNDCF